MQRDQGQNMQPADRNTAPGRKRADLLILPLSPTDPSPENHEKRHTLTTRVDLLEKIDVALTSSTTTSIAHPAITNSGCLSITRVCAEWNLNEKQSIAFAVCAAALLQKVYANTNSTKVYDSETTRRIIKNCTISCLFKKNNTLLGWIGRHWKIEGDLDHCQLCR